MPMLMMQIGYVRMAVALGGVGVSMAVLAWGHGRVSVGVGVSVVAVVVAVGVFVVERFVGMLMAVVFGQVQPNAQQHQAASE